MVSCLPRASCPCHPQSRGGTRRGTPRRVGRGARVPGAGMGGRCPAHRGSRSRAAARGAGRAAGSQACPVGRPSSGWGRSRPRCAPPAAPGFRGRGYMMMVGVGKGPPAGGSYRFAPDADPADGKLDVCLIRRVSLPRFLLAIPRVMRGTHVTMREVALIKTAKLVIRSPEEPLMLHTDGVLREPGVNECSVELERDRLNVLLSR